MLDDIVESLRKPILKGISRLFFEILVEILFFYTGEIVLFIVTLGKKKPSWNYYAGEPTSKWVIFTEFSTWVGIAFWLFIAWLINNILFS